MRRLWRSVPSLGIAAVAWTWAAPIPAQPLTVERAVELALERSTQVVNAEASVLDARSGVFSAYSGILPRLFASYSRDGFSADNRTTGTASVIGGQVVPPGSTDFESYSTTPSVSGSWSVFNLSSLTQLSSARNGARAARLRHTATRNEVALQARRQFYEVVKAIQLSLVATDALKLARDDERRVNALFEVGSVSKSDVLSARVRASQSELDSLTAHHAVTVQRIALANLIGLPESEMVAIDTTLSAQPRSYDLSETLAEAERNRPDLKAAEAEYRAAKAGLRAASFSRLPYLTVSGSASFNTKSASVTDFSGVFFDSTSNQLVPFRDRSDNRVETDRTLSGSIALNLNIFDGFAMDSRIAAARARKIRAEEERDALRRNLEGEVRRALLTYREALEGYEVAQRAIESATENVKLTQQKYNVGSATILELIDVQVQLQRAKSNGVSALAAIRVAEAEIDRVRGRGER